MHGVSMPKKYEDILFLEPFTESIKGTWHIGHWDGANWLSGDDETVIDFVSHFIVPESTAALVDELENT